MTDPDTTEEAKYEIDIEGALKPWDKDTITTEQIAALGGWDPSVGVLRVNLEDGTEETLQPGGGREDHTRASRSVSASCSRGARPDMEERLEAELALIREQHSPTGSCREEGRWVFIPSYRSSQRAGTAR